MAAISLGFIVIVTPYTIQEVVAACTGSKVIIIFTNSKPHNQCLQTYCATVTDTKSIVKDKMNNSNQYPFLYSGAIIFAIAIIHNLNFISRQIRNRQRWKMQKKVVTKNYSALKLSIEMNLI